MAVEIHYASSSGRKVSARKLRQLIQQLRESNKYVGEVEEKSNAIHQQEVEDAEQELQENLDNLSSNTHG